MWSKSENASQKCFEAKQKRAQQKAFRQLF